MSAGAGLAAFARGLQEMAPVGERFVGQLAASQAAKDRADRVAYAEQAGKLAEMKYKAKNAGVLSEFNSAISNPISGAAILSNAGIHPSIVQGPEAWKASRAAESSNEFLPQTPGASDLSNKIMSSGSGTGGYSEASPSLASSVLSNAMNRPDAPDLEERAQAAGDLERYRTSVGLGLGKEDIAMASDLAGASRIAASDVYGRNKDIQAGRVGAAEKVYSEESKQSDAAAKVLAEAEAAKAGHEYDLEKIGAQGDNARSVAGINAEARVRAASISDPRKVMDSLERMRVNTEKQSADEQAGFIKLKIGNAPIEKQRAYLDARGIKYDEVDKTIAGVKVPFTDVELKPHWDERREKIRQIMADQEIALNQTMGRPNKAANSDVSLDDEDVTLDQGKKKPGPLK